MQYSASQIGRNPQHVHLTEGVSRKGKGKGNGGKGEHEGKGGGGVGRQGTQQVESLVMDETQENHRDDVRKLVEMMQKEEDQEGQRGRVALNVGAGGSHPQAMSAPERREAQEMRWADCEDDEGKEEEESEQEREGDREWFW